jgi:hypothetical protein
MGGFFFIKSTIQQYHNCGILAGVPFPVVEKLLLHFLSQFFFAFFTLAFGPHIPCVICAPRHLQRIAQPRNPQPFLY